MDRALRANVITKSGKAVETAGDVDTLLLDKTGTITIGNRKATRFYPSAGVDEQHFVRACMLSSLSDETPEGKSIVELGRESHLRMRDIDTAVTRMIKFTAETRCSGVDLADGTRIRKGAFDSIRAIAERAGTNSRWKRNKGSARFPVTGNTAGSLREREDSGSYRVTGYYKAGYLGTFRAVA